MRIDVTCLAPPGFQVKVERDVFLVGSVLAGIYSMSFLLEFVNEKEKLYEVIGEERVLKPNAIMPDFVEILDLSLVGFVILAIGMLAFIAVHYAYHHQHSKSIYLMRRLPDRFELHRRCIALPVLAAMLCMAMWLLLLLIYFAVYMLATPESCLAPNQWEKIWRVLL